MTGGRVSFRQPEAEAVAGARLHGGRSTIRWAKARRLVKVGLVELGSRDADDFEKMMR